MVLYIIFAGGEAKRANGIDKNHWEEFLDKPPPTLQTVRNIYSYILNAQKSSPYQNKEPEKLGKLLYNKVYVAVKDDTCRIEAEEFFKKHNETYTPIYRTNDKNMNKLEEMLGIIDEKADPFVICMNGDTYYSETAIATATEMMGEYYNKIQGLGGMMFILKGPYKDEPKIKTASKSGRLIEIYNEKIRTDLSPAMFGFVNKPTTALIKRLIDDKRLPEADRLKTLCKELKDAGNPIYVQQLMYQNEPITYEEHNEKPKEETEHVEMLIELAEEDL